MILSAKRSPLFGSCAAKTQAQGKALLRRLGTRTRYGAAISWGVRLLCRAERPFQANPTNLIRVMPAEGEEMHNPTISRARRRGVPPQIAAAAARPPARAQPPRPLHHQRGGAEFHRQRAARGRLRAVDDAVARGDRRSFVARSQALLVNLGTFDRERREATEIAVETASQDNVPWVLDPVFVDRAPPRAAFARELVGRAPKGGAAQSRRIFRFGRRRTDARRARRLRPRPENSRSGCRARPIWSPTASASPPSPTAIR